MRRQTRSYLLGIVIALCLMPHVVWAQQSVKVRSGVHTDYNRLVFDWPQRPTYTAKKSGNTLTLTFKSAAVMNIDGVDLASLPNIVALKPDTGDANVSSAAITINENSKYRNFTIGNKIIVDVYNPPAGGKRAAASIEAEKEENPKPKQQAPKRSDENIIESKLTDAMKDQDNVIIDGVQNNDDGADEKDEIETITLAPPDIEPHVIKITSTRSFGMGVFERGGWLWMIMDDPDIGVPPQLIGPTPEKFGDLDRFNISDGLAYRLKLPQGVHASGRGGGLTWEIVLSPFGKDQTSTPLQREYDDSDPVRGGGLIWPVAEAKTVLEFRDPEIGDNIKLVTTDVSNVRHYATQNFIELDTLPATIGLAVTSKVDDLEVSLIDNQVLISRTGGLVLAQASDIKSRELEQQFDDGEGETPKSDMRKIFSFDTWGMGGFSALRDNQTVLLAGLNNKETDDQVTDLLTLAKLNLTNQRAHETLGFLRVAESQLPDIAEAPEYIALRAAANIMAGRAEESIADVTDDRLSDIGEVGYWRSYAFSQVEDWQQAFQNMPKDFVLLETYPELVRLPVTLALAEVALRGADMKSAEELLGGIRDMAENSFPRYEAGWKYLSGELDRQRNNPDGAANYWRDLENHVDDYHRVKASLALTQLERDRDLIKAEDAIDRLEGLRYAWRGDQLETLINYRLAMAYIDEKEYLKGLTMLRNAASITPGTKLADYVTQELTQLFRDIFANDIVQDIPAIDAITLYEEFRELTPPGEEGDIVTLKLADRLANAELMGRATDMLQQLVTRRLSGERKIQAGLRLAGIQLLDDKPEGTLRTLDIVEKEIQSASSENEELKPKYIQEIALLKARAMAEMDDTEAALDSLGDLPADKDVLRIKVDLAWADGRWEDAANALQDLIFLENVTTDKALSDDHAELILNRSIALNLSGDRVALANLRNRYGERMDETSKARLFNVVSRERQSRLSGNREVLSQMIGEVDLFGDFLDIYKSGIDSENN